MRLGLCRLFNLFFSQSSSVLSLKVIFIRVIFTYFRLKQIQTKHKHKDKQTQTMQTYVYMCG